MVIREKNILFLTATLLLIGVASVLFIPSKKARYNSEASSQEKQNKDSIRGQLSSDLLDNEKTMPTSRKVSPKRNENIDTSVDRSSPQKAFVSFIDSLRSLDFIAYYSSFSESGKAKLTEGRSLTEEGIEDMSKAFKQAGFTDLIVESQTLVKKEENFAEIVSDISSVRKGRMRKEHMSVIFEYVSGEWLVSELSIQTIEN